MDTAMNLNFDPSHYCSSPLSKDDGIWKLQGQTKVHYPNEGHLLNAQLEKDSYWFSHRTRCIMAALEYIPPNGPLFDLGGGNGIVSLALQANGYQTILIEPSPTGVEIARDRGVTEIIRAPIQDIPFRANILPNIGLFDVLEHIQNDFEFLKSVVSLLKPGGHIYLTVPGQKFLWSDEDEWACHFRRYEMNELEELLVKTGFQINYLSPFFSFLVAPIYVFRHLPFSLGFKRKGNYEKDHRTNIVTQTLFSPIGIWELKRIQAGEVIPTGSSIMVIATKL